MYELEERTLNFSKVVREYCKNLKKTLINLDDIKQVIRSSGSIGANYIEANESLSKKDFILRIKIAKKEAKETVFWLRVMNANEQLINEAEEIMKILGAILKKVT